MDELIKQLAASGPTGIVAAIALWMLYQKDKQGIGILRQVQQEQSQVLRDLRDTLVKHTEASTTLAERINDLPDKLIQWESRKQGIR